VNYIRKTVIPKAVKDLLKEEDLSTLYEIRDLLSDMISMREAPLSKIGPTRDQAAIERS
jgi:hypothetical protein